MKIILYLLLVGSLFANDYICIKFDKKFYNKKKELLGTYSYKEKKKIFFKEKGKFLSKDNESEIYIKEEDNEANIFQGNNKWLVYPKHKDTFYLIEKYKKSNDILRYFCIEKKK